MSVYPSLPLRATVIRSVRTQTSNGSWTQISTEVFSGLRCALTSLKFEDFETLAAYTTEQLTGTLYVGDDFALQAGDVVTIRGEKHKVGAAGGPVYDAHGIAHHSRYPVRRVA